MCWAIHYFWYYFCLSIWQPASQSVSQSVCLSVCLSRVVQYTQFMYLARINSSLLLCLLSIPNTNWLQLGVLDMYVSVCPLTICPPGLHFISEMACFHLFALYLFAYIFGYLHYSNISHAVGTYMITGFFILHRSSLWQSCYYVWYSLCLYTK